MPTIEERLARLEKAAEPEAKPSSVSASPQLRFDPSSRLSLPASVTRDMVNAVPDAMVRDIVKDHLGRPTSLPTVHGRTPKRATPNYVDERPLPTFGNENWPRKKEA